MKSRAVVLACLSVAFAAVADGVPQKSEVVAGVNPETAESLFRGRELDALEGIWYYPDEKMLLCIESVASSPIPAAERYRIVMVEAEDMSVAPGTIIGYLEDAASPAKYRLWLYSTEESGVLQRPVECVATVGNGGRLIEIERTKLRMRVSANLTRFLPSIFRAVRVAPYIDREDMKPGFRKVYPPGEAAKPVYF